MPPASCMLPFQVVPEKKERVASMGCRLYASWFMVYGNVAGRLEGNKKREDKRAQVKEDLRLCPTTTKLCLEYLNSEVPGWLGTWWSGVPSARRRALC